MSNIAASEGQALIAKATAAGVNLEDFTWKVLRNTPANVSAGNISHRDADKFSARIPAAPRGWSTASRGRSQSDVVAGMLDRPATYSTDCHYCGQPTRNGFCPECV